MGVVLQILSVESVAVLCVLLCLTGKGSLKDFDCGCY